MSARKNTVPGRRDQLEGFRVNLMQTRARESFPGGGNFFANDGDAQRSAALARLVWIFLPRRRVLRNPLGRVVLRNKALDDFRFAIGPQNIDPPTGAGIFASHEGWSLLVHRVTMRRRWPATSQ